MQDEVYRQKLKMRALERWENEGGRIDPQKEEQGRTENPDRVAV